MKKLTTTGWTLVIIIITMGLIIGGAFSKANNEIMRASQIVVSTADKRSILYTGNGDLIIEETDGQLKIRNQTDNSVCIIKLNDDLIWIAKTN